MLEPQVDGMGLSAVFLGLAMGQHGPIALQDSCGLIGREAVLDDVFQSAIVLVQHSFNGSSQEIALVEGWGNQGNRERFEPRSGHVLSGYSEWPGPVLLHDPQADA